jgi:hypothetical protein
MKWTILLLAIVMFAGAMPIFGQSQKAGESKASTTDQLELTRSEVQTQRKSIVAANMLLTEQEVEKFWPIYNEYQDALRKLGDRAVNMIMDYAKNYDSMTDDKAKALLDEYLTLDAERVALKRSYAEKFGKVLSPKKVVRLMQIENKLDAIINIDLATQIPLVK